MTTTAIHNDRRAVASRILPRAVYTAAAADRREWAAVPALAARPGKTTLLLNI